VTLERLTLRNFQTHERLVVDLDPHVTTLVGRSDCGKSSVLRALSWICLNRPQGAEFIRWGASTATVKLRVDGGQLLQRRRGSGNTYRLVGGTPLKAFGTGVPKPVADLLDVGDANFHGQLDGPYWFDLPAAEVSRRLNAIINLSEIDAALEAAARHARRSKAAAEVSEERLAAARARRDQFRWAVEADDKLGKVEHLERACQKTALKRARLVSLLQTHAGATKRKETLAAAVVALGRAVGLARQASQAARKREELARLGAQLTRYEELATLVLPDAGPARRASDRAEQAHLRRRRLSSLLNGLANLEYELCDLDKRIRRIKKRLRVCPTCGRPWPVASQTSTCPSASPPPAANPRPNGSRPRPTTSDRSMTLPEALASRS
jgi:DNA repair protein SbcC/Rad50